MGLMTTASVSVASHVTSVQICVCALSCPVVQLLCNTGAGEVILTGKAVCRRKGIKSFFYCFFLDDYCLINISIHV